MERLRMRMFFLFFLCSFLGSKQELQGSTSTDYYCPREIKQRNQRATNFHLVNALLPGNEISNQCSVYTVAKR